MNREFLQDYEAREIEDARRFAKKVEKYGLQPDDTFPPLDRFNQLPQKPMLIGDRTCYLFNKEKIWTQIPFAGTTIFPLYPSTEKNLLRMNGFESSDIPRLVDMAKELKKVNFVLEGRPTEYEGLDYLKPIFDELSPPLWHTVPVAAYVEPNIFDEWKKEFIIESESVYFPYLIAASRHMSQGRIHADMSMSRDSQTFAYLRLLHLDDIVDEILMLMITEPDKAREVLDRYGILLHPRFTGLRVGWSQSLAKLHHHHIDHVKKNDPITYDFEIGRYLMKKIIPHPTSFDACKEVIFHYKENDLYNVLGFFSKSLDKNDDRLYQSFNQLEEVLENIWNDASKLNNHTEIIRTGISVIIGVMGYATEPNLTGFGGLLASAGFNVLDRKLDSSSLSEKMVRFFSKDYLVNIYDFQQKILPSLR